VVDGSTSKPFGIDDPATPLITPQRSAPVAIRHGVAVDNWALVGHGVVLGFDPGADLLRRLGQLVEPGEHGLVVGPCTRENLGERSGELGLGALEIAQQRGELTLLITTQIAHVDHGK
jgi:hypothetical protein